MIEGVRKRRVDFWDVMRGKNACRVVNGARRRVFRVSDQLDGEKEATEHGGRVGPGTKIRALKCSVCDGAFGKCCLGVFICVVNFFIVSSVESGYNMTQYPIYKSFWLQGSYRCYVQIQWTNVRF